MEARREGGQDRGGFLDGARHLQPCFRMQHPGHAARVPPLTPHRCWQWAPALPDQAQRRECCGESRCALCHPAGHQVEPLPRPSGELRHGAEACACLSAFPTWTGPASPVGSWELRKRTAGSENKQQRAELEEAQGLSLFLQDTRVCVCTCVCPSIPVFWGPRKKLQVPLSHPDFTPKAENKPVPERSPGTVSFFESPA